MPRVMCFASLVALMLTAAPHAAQEAQRFTGTWTMDMTRSETAAQGADASPRLPITITISEQSDRLSIVREVDGREERATYRFEARAAAERPVGTSGERLPAIEPVFAEWKDGQLVTTTVYRVNGTPLKKIESRTLSADGREMVVETQLQMQHGYQSSSNQPQGYTTARDVYMKSF